MPIETGGKMAGAMAGEIRSRTDHQEGVQLTKEMVLVERVMTRMRHSDPNHKQNLHKGNRRLVKKV